MKKKKKKKKTEEDGRMDVPEEEHIPPQDMVSVDDFMGAHDKSHAQRKTLWVSTD